MCQTSDSDTPPVCYWGIGLYEFADPGVAVAGEKVYDRDFDHGVGAGLQARGGAGHSYEYLCGERGIVDRHGELKPLVLGGA